MKQPLYKCFINGEFYGIGDLDYMRELFVDYVVTCKMYGKDEIEWKIVKTKETEIKINAKTKL